MINLANKLTVIRMLMAPLFMILFLIDNLYSKYLALLVFIGAAFTDLYDGHIARRKKVVTKFGKLMDPIADKLLVSAALISLVELREIPAWMVILIIGREFVISGLRALATSEGVVIAASRISKYKTFSQVVAVIFALTLSCLRHSFSGFFLRWGALASNVQYSLLLIAVAISLLSGWDYLKGNIWLIVGDVKVK